MQEIHALARACDALGYVVEDELATVLYLMLRLEKPLLLEGNPGVGKTEVTQIMAAYLETDLIRLQCYEGLDAHAALYEWNYQKQLLAIKINEQSGLHAEEQEARIFGEAYLLKRPLLQAITAPDRAPVLLIDEVDRADEEFEAFLLELLSAYQISIPEMGTIRATHKPVVILTSNRTRELSDALKRRCLYHWVDYPPFERELKIIHKHLPDIDDELATRLVRFVEQLRTMRLDKAPGIAETIDWARSLLALGATRFEEPYVSRSLGAVLKSDADIRAVREHGVEALLESTR
ncbi:ATPase [Rhodothermaceae bacterium RA]|nr:ATPase [Rhodothermaceae bacterium RA]